MSTPTTTPPPADAGFDPMVFWIQHKTKVVLLAILLVVGLGTFAISEYLRTSSNNAAQDLFSKAESADAYRQIITEFPNSGAAGNAYLMLGEKLRQEGKFEESTKTLRSFADKHPDHELVSGAWTSIAVNQEAEGKVDEALATYQKVTTGYPNSFSAPVAYLAQARILNGQGKVEDARRIYEQVMTQYQDNVVAQQASQELRRLKK